MVTTFTTPIKAEEYTDSLIHKIYSLRDIYVAEYYDSLKQSAETNFER